MKEWIRKLDLVTGNIAVNVEDELIARAVKYFKTSEKKQGFRMDAFDKLSKGQKKDLFTTSVYIPLGKEFGSLDELLSAEQTKNPFNSTLLATITSDYAAEKDADTATLTTSVLNIKLPTSYSYFNLPVGDLDMLLERLKEQKAVVNYSKEAATASWRNSEVQSVNYKVILAQQETQHQSAILQLLEECQRMMKNRMADFERDTQERKKRAKYHSVEEAEYLSFVCPSIVDLIGRLGLKEHVNGKVFLNTNENVRGELKLAIGGEHTVENIDTAADAAILMDISVEADRKDAYAGTRYRSSLRLPIKGKYANIPRQEFVRIVESIEGVSWKDVSTIPFQFTFQKSDSDNQAEDRLVSLVSNLSALLKSYDGPDAAIPAYPVAMRTRTRNVVYSYEEPHYSNPPVVRTRKQKFSDWLHTLFGKKPPYGGKDLPGEYVLIKKEQDIQRSIPLAELSITIEGSNLPPFKAYMPQEVLNSLHTTDYASLVGQLKEQAIYIPVGYEPYLDYLKKTAQTAKMLNISVTNKNIEIKHPAQVKEIQKKFNLPSKEVVTVKDYAITVCF